MKFKKEINVIIEGEIYDEYLDPIELFKSLKISWKHWWEDNPNWIYGKPSKPVLKGTIDKISIAKLKNNN